MAKLTTQARNKLPAKAFAGPNRSFPIPDKSHARNALARVQNSKLSSSAQKTVVAKAHAKLRKG